MLRIPLRIETKKPPGADEKAETRNVWTCYPNFKVHWMIFTFALSNIFTRVTQSHILILADIFIRASK